MNPEKHQMENEKKLYIKNEKENERKKSKKINSGTIEGNKNII